MAIIDLRSLEGDQVVIHFGGEFTNVDAYTLANSLVAFADTAAAVNAVINPGQTIEIRVEAIGPGSFRALIKKVQKGASGFFSRGAEQLFWGIVAALIVQRLASGDPTTTIRITSDGVVVETGSNTTIISKDVFEEAERAKGSEEVQKCLGRTFETLERDKAIKSFGLTPRMDDLEPAIEIPRDDFPRLIERPTILESEQRRIKTRKRSCCDSKGLVQARSTQMVV